MRHIIPLFLLLLLSCQEKNKKITVITQEKKDTREHVCNLQENINLVGNIKDFSFYDNSSFFVLADNNIIEYTVMGEQLNVFNRMGQGPGEYVTPTLINIYNESIYIWCSSTLKLIEYDRKGRFIRENLNYRKAIKNFKLLDENSVCFYKSDGQKDAIIEIYSLKEDKIIKSIQGELTDEDLLLLSVASKPNMIVEGGNLYFTKPSELSLYHVDLKTFSLSKDAFFEDDEFIVKKVQDAHSMFNSDPQGVLTYMAENSIVDNLLKVGNNFYIKSEIGKYIIDFQKRKMEIDQRFDKYYLCDFRHPNVENIKAIKENKKRGTHRYALFGSDTYLLEVDNSNEDEQVRMKVYKLNF